MWKRPENTDPLDEILSEDTPRLNDWSESERNEIRAGREMARVIRNADEARIEERRARMDRVIDYVVGDVRARSGNAPPKRGWWARFWHFLCQKYEDFWGVLLPSQPADVIVYPNPSRGKSRLIRWGMTATVVTLLAVGLAVGALFLGDQGSDHQVDDGVIANYYGGERGRIHNLSAEVVLALGAETQVRQFSSTEIRLDQGQVWLDVEPGGKGFVVRTDLGEVRVLGTSFGVERLKNSVRVEVAEGVVQFHDESKSKSILMAGRELIVQSDGSRQSTARAGGDSKAVWARQIESRAFANEHPALVAYWPMELLETPDGMILPDQGPHGLDAYTTGPVSTADSVHPLFGGAARFNRARKTEAVIPTPAPLNSLDGDFTFSCWAKLERSRIYQRFMSSRLILNGFNVGVSEERFDLNFGSEIHNIPLPTSPNGVWAHYAFAHDFDQEVTRFYMNGELIATEKQSRSEYQSEAVNWYIGRNRYPGDPGFLHKDLHFNGCLDEIRIYNEALTSDEIRRISMVDYIDLQ